MIFNKHSLICGAILGTGMMISTNGMLCGIDHGSFFVTGENDAWCYDSNSAPYDVELVGVYNGGKIKTLFIKRTKHGWESTRMGTNESSKPDCWLLLPTTSLPKKISLVGYFTKGELEEKLKGFDE